MAMRDSFATRLTVTVSTDIEVFSGSEILVTFFLVVLLFADVNPFEKVDFQPVDGRGGLGRIRVAFLGPRGLGRHHAVADEGGELVLQVE